LYAVTSRVCQLPDVSSPNGPEDPRGKGTLTTLFLKRSAYAQVRFANRDNGLSLVKSGEAGIVTHLVDNFELTVSQLPEQKEIVQTFGLDGEVLWKIHRL
jgi:hypothetical protein